MDRFDDLPPALRPSADRPLAGLTILLVDGSRPQGEAMRHHCARSGARLRRADTLAAAERHLRAYRPGAVIVDVELPDGSGLDLLRRLAGARPRIPALLAASTDPAQAGPAAAAGADGFLAMPVAGLAAFQAALLSALLPRRQPAPAHLLNLVPHGARPPGSHLAGLAEVPFGERPLPLDMAGAAGAATREAGLADAVQAGPVPGAPVPLAPALLPPLGALPAR